jgi:uncharacterized membrane protein
MRSRWLAVRIVTSRPRFFAGILCGVVLLIMMPPIMDGPSRALICWDVGVAVYIAMAFQLFLHPHIEFMPAQAAAQEEGEWTIFAVTIAATVICLVAILGEFSRTKGENTGQQTARVLLVVVTLALTWLMVHVTFAFRYAHEFYAMSEGKTEVDGGLQFPGEDDPDYLDFMYFSLVLGMTFQVSDVQITSRKLRRVATVQGVLSFVFNTVILALTVNIAASLL